MAQNSCSTGVHMNINHKFRKLLGHQQAGVVYLWTMLDIIINITPDVAAGLNIRIKLFGENGLKGLYPKGVNFDSLVLNYGSICHSLDHQGSLVEDAPVVVAVAVAVAAVAVMVAVAIVIIDREILVHQ